MGRTFSKCVYLAVKICRRTTFSNTNVVFPVLENFIPIAKKNKKKKTKVPWYLGWAGRLWKNKAKQRR